MFHTNNKELWDFVNNIVEFNINEHVAENVVEVKYQGVPVGGYNKLIDRLLEGVDTMFSMDFFKDRAKWETIADEIVFTGRIDEYFNYACGKLEYSTECIDDIDFSYPVNEERNTSLYEHYKTLANAIDNVYFGGPLSEYKHYDPASTMEAAVRLWERVR